MPSQLRLSWFIQSNQMSFQVWPAFAAAVIHSLFLAGRFTSVVHTLWFTVCVDFYVQVPCSTTVVASRTQFNRAVWRTGRKSRSYHYCHPSASAHLFPHFRGAPFPTLCRLLEQKSQPYLHATQGSTVARMCCRTTHISNKLRKLWNSIRRLQWLSSEYFLPCKYFLWCFEQGKRSKPCKIFTT